jgi:hypothetical protein
MRDTKVHLGSRALAQAKQKYESQLNELIEAAKTLNIEVRTEKLLREVGYRARSGRCRLNGRELILVDRDASISDQIDFLSTELTQRQRETLQPDRRPDKATEA